MTLLGVTLTALCWAAVAGAPLAWAVRDSRGRLGPFLYDAVAAGTVLTVLVMVAWVWFHRIGLVAGVVLAVGGSAVAVVAAARGPARPWPVRVRLFDVVWLVVVGGAFLLRTRVSDNVFWVNDMGAYVNWANQFARADLWTASFPPAFPALLALPAKLGGPLLTTDVLPVLGLLVVAGVARVTGLLRLPLPVRLGAVVLAAISPHLVWNTTFNASESLHTPLFLLTAVVLARIWTTRPSWRGAFPGLVVLSGATSAALALNRASQLVLVAVVVLVVLTGWAPAWRGRGRALGWWSAASVLGIGIGWVYGVSRIPDYYVTAQLSEFVPTSLLARLEAHGLLRGGVGAVAWTALAAVVLGLGALAQRRGARPGRGVRATRWPLPLTALLGLASVGVLVRVADPGGELRAILARMGWVLAVAALLGLVVPAAVRGARGPVAVWLGGAGATVLALQSARFSTVLPHLNHLYWDRYLVSEYLPAALVLAATGVAGSVETLRRVVEGRRGRHLATALGALVAATAVVVAAVGWAPEVRLQQHGTLYGGAAGFVDRLAALTPAGTPVVWTSTDPTRDLTGIFPNSAWAVGSTLALTYGRDVPNRPTQEQPFGRDAPLADSVVAPFVACAPGGVVTVVAWWPTGTPLTPPPGDLQWTELGRVEGRAEVLHQDLAPSGWSDSALRAAVYRVSDPDHTAGDCAR